MAMTPEGKVKAKVVAILKKYNVWYHFVANNGYGSAGCPDILACVKGRFLALEIKADASKKPTALQQLSIDKIHAAQGLAMVVHDSNLDLLITILEELTA